MWLQQWLEKEAASRPQVASETLNCGYHLQYHGRPQQGLKAEAQMLIFVMFFFFRDISIDTCPWRQEGKQGDFQNYCNWD